MDMEASLQDYLHTHIPLSQAMGLRVAESSPSRVTLRFPLSPNVNHKGTAFGGSLQAAGLLACWSIAREVLRAAGETSFAIVVKESTTKFRRPVEGEFEATADISSDAAREFAENFRAHGKARLEARAELRQGEMLCATLNGVFVALRR